MGGVSRTNYRSPSQKKTSNGIVAMTRRDSALEVFRHNPTDGSKKAERSSALRSEATYVYAKRKAERSSALRSEAT